MSAELTGDLSLKEILKHTGHNAPVEKCTQSLTQILEDSDDIENMNSVVPMCLSDVSEETARSWSGKKVVIHCNLFGDCDELFKGRLMYETNHDIHLDTYKDEEFVIDFSGQEVYVDGDVVGAFGNWFIKVLG